MWDFSLFLVAFDSDATPMRFNGELARGETEASPDTRTTAFHLAKLFENALVEFWRDPWPVVNDGNTHGVAGLE